MSIIIAILLLKIVAQTQANINFYSLFAIMWFNNFIKVFYLLLFPLLCGVDVR